MRQLNGQDATFLYLETPGAHLHLTGLYVYRQPRAGAGRLNFPDIYALISSALTGVHELHQKLVRPPLDIDYPSWVDDADFAMEEHVRPFMGARPRSRRALFRAVAAIHSEPLDLTRPPWEMQVMDRLDGIAGLPRHCFAIVMKYHHAAIDGASGAQLVDRLHGIEPPQGLQQSTGPSTWLSTGQARPGTLGLLVRAALNNTANVVALSRTLGSAMPGLLAGLASDVLPVSGTGATAKSPVPLTRFNAAVSSERVMHAVSVELGRLQSLRKAVPGATINDVLLAICGGALRRWLQRQDELPVDPLVAMVPMNTRRKNAAVAPGNQISTLFLPIGTHIADPIQRLQAIHAVSRQAKSGEGPLDPQQLNSISSHIPALPLALLARLATGVGLGFRGPRLCNCTITNVPPPGTELQLGPAPMVFAIGNGPLIDGMGLIISIFTYAGTANLCFTSCPRMLPEPATLGRDAEGEISSFEQALAGNG